MNPEFWRGKHVLLTGHTGFKGSWLSLWLQRLGAIVTGYALPVDSPESLFELGAVGKHMESVYGDVRDLVRLQCVIDKYQPEIVFHMAAQALVRKSYREPVETYAVNVMGTIHLLEAVRRSQSCRAIVNVTSDKCYENKEWAWGYRESDSMGGRDPYSSSKGCAELVTSAYWHSFYEPQKESIAAVASARAGNVIGGGDFSKDRIVSDFMSAISRGEPLHVRNPHAVRPWQHVLEPLSGYLLLAEKLWESREYAHGWNFGPAPDDIQPVCWLVERLNHYWGEHIDWQIDTAPKPHEAHLLLLDSAQSRMQLGWKPRWSLDQAIKAVVEWHKAHSRSEPLREIVMQQIASYEDAA